MRRQAERFVQRSWKSKGDNTEGEVGTQQPRPCRKQQAPAPMGLIRDHAVGQDTGSSLSSHRNREKLQMTSHRCN